MNKKEAIAKAKELGLEVVKPSSTNLFRAGRTCTVEFRTGKWVIIQHTVMVDNLTNRREIEEKRQRNAAALLGMNVQTAPKNLYSGLATYSKGLVDDLIVGFNVIHP